MGTLSRGLSASGTAGYRKVGAMSYFTAAGWLMMCVLTMWVFAWIRLWSYLNSQFLAGELSVVSALFFVHDDMIWHQFSGTEFHPCKSSHPGPSSCWTTSRNMEPSQLPHTLITALVCGAPCSYPITPQMCPGDAMTHSSWLKRQTTFTSCCWSEVLRSAEVEGGNKHKTFSVCF